MSAPAFDGAELAATNDWQTQAGTAVRAALTVICLLAVVFLGCSAQFYKEALLSPYFALTLIGAVIIQFRTIPSWRDALFVLVGIIALAGFDFEVLHFRATLFGWFSFAGLASLTVLGVRTIWAERGDRKLLLYAFVPALLFSVSEYFADDLLSWTSQVHPKALDLYLYSFDASLGVQVPFIIGRAFSRWTLLRFPAVLFYIGLSIPMALIYAGRLVRCGSEKAIECFVALIATGPIGIVFYNILPALGPAHLFGSNFPWSPLSLHDASKLFLEPVSLVGPRNAIPSLHTAWVLLAWWYSRGLSVWERGVALLFVIFVILATLGTGEHYLVDLVVAFPFALGVESIAAFGLGWTGARRLAGVGFGFAATLLWLLALRFLPHIFWSTPVLPWSMCIVTVVISVYLEHRLHSAAGNPVPAAHESIAAPSSKPISQET